ncbi:MAG: hypothetical protein JWN64_35 [Parcubacteria group bacterium]|nr:hypothetical protein [Parcubacteria group bacterium]
MKKAVPALGSDGPAFVADTRLTLLVGASSDDLAHGLTTVGTDDTRNRLAHRDHDPAGQSDLVEAVLFSNEADPGFRPDLHVAEVVSGATEVALLTRALIDEQIAPLVFAGLEKRSALRVRQRLVSEPRPVQFVPLAEVVDLGDALLFRSVRDADRVGAVTRKHDLLGHGVHPGLFAFVEFPSQTVPDGGVSLAFRLETRHPVTALGRIHHLERVEIGGQVRDGVEVLRVRIAQLEHLQELLG